MDRSLLENPGEVEPLMVAAISCNRLGRFEKAVERFEQALRLDRSLEAAYGHKMESLRRMGTLSLVSFFWRPHRGRRR